MPYGALTFDETNALLRLNVDKQKFKAAPAFAMSRWAEQSQSLRVAEVYRYYGQEPYFASDGHASKSGNTATEPLGFVQRSSKLIHLPVKDKQNKQLGIVSSFLFDLPHGRIIHVIVMAPGFQTKSVIPARALRYNAKRDALLLDDSAQAFKDEPRFKWTYGENGDFQQETYANVKVAANDGVNTRQNVHEGSSGAYTPLVQGSSFRDVDKRVRTLPYRWRRRRGRRANGSSRGGRRRQRPPVPRLARRVLARECWSRPGGS